MNTLSECWSVSPTGDRIDRHFLAWLNGTAALDAQGGKTVAESNLLPKTRSWLDAENKTLARHRKPKLDWEHLNGED